MKTRDESKINVDEVVADLLRETGSIGLYGSEARLFIQAVRRLAGGRPLTARDVGEIAALVGLSSEEANSVLARLAERNKAGEIVGLAGLSLNQWNHRFEIQGRPLSTWCALDTLYLPQVLRQEARVLSRDPMTKGEIRFKLGPDGVVDAPADAILSIVVPQIDRQGLESVEQIWNAFCSYSNFFVSLDSARRWFDSRSIDPVFLSIDQGFELGSKWFAEILEYA